MIRIGTSGYSYDDWVGPFYPEGASKNEFLDYYRQHFGTTELNFTYYRMPSARMLENIGNKVQPGFRFSVKAPGEITHEREGNPRPAARQFVEALAPLREPDKFACALLQFPTSFKPGEASEAYLKQLAEAFADTPAVVEFRHRGWITEDTFDLLQENGLGFCCVDQPQFESLIPPIAIATSEIGYVRFHGRNYQKWWHHDEAWERYDHMYTAGELSEWVPKLKALDEQRETQETYVYMNNHWAGQAPASGKLLAKLLRAADARVADLPPSE